MLYKKSGKIVAMTILSTFLFNTQIYADEKVAVMIEGKEYIYEKGSVSLFIDGVKQENLSTDPLIYGNYLYVPARDIFEPLGAQVEYIDKTCTIIYNNTVVIFKVDNSTALINNTEFTMPATAKIINNKLMLPARFVSEALNFGVTWDDVTKSVGINTTSSGNSDFGSVSETPANNSEDDASNPTNIENENKPVSNQNSSVSLVVNGVIQENLTTPPLIFGNYLHVPAREVFEPMGASVSYDNKTSTCTINFEDTSIAFKVNEASAVVNGQKVTMPTTAKIINDKLLVPLRFISETLNFEVNWDDATRVVEINTTKNLTPEKPPESNVVIEPPKEEKPTTVIEIPKEEEPAENTGNNNTHYEDDIASVEKEDIGEKITVVDKSTAPNLDYMGTETGKLYGALKTETGYSFEFSEPISYLEKQIISGDRLVFDIQNATLAVPDKTKVINDEAVYQIRYGETDTKSSRIVLDLKAGTNFQVSYSADRKYINVDFEENTIQDIKFSQDSNFDYIEIKNSKTITPVVNFAANPSRLIIDFNNSVFDIKGSSAFKGNYITANKTQNHGSNIGRIVVDLNCQGTYTTETVGNVTKIKIGKPTVTNVSYNYESKRFTLKKASGFNIGDVSKKDNYLKSEYIVDLGVSFSNVLGYGKYFVSDGRISHMEISTDGTTKLILTGSQALVVNVSEDKDNVYIDVLTAKEAYPLVAVVDPGHGGHDGGASRNGVTEKVLNTDIAERVLALANRDDIIKVYLSKEGDTFISLTDRASIGNRLGDIFVSIHHNSSTSSSPQGTETYYFPGASDGKALATIMQRKLIENLNSTNRGIKTANFSVLRNSTIPSVLLEIGFVSNSHEAALLAQPEYRQRAAEAIYAGLLESADSFGN